MVYSRGVDVGDGSGVGVTIGDGVKVIVEVAVGAMVRVAGTLVFALSGKDNCPVGTQLLNANINMINQKLWCFFLFIGRMIP